MNKSVIKGLNLLNYLAEANSNLSLSELAKLSGIPKPTAYRLLSTLEYMGYVSKVRHTDQDVRYRLGLKLLELGGIVADRLELRNIALPLMKKLQSNLNETVHLVIREDNEAVYIEKVESNHALRLYTRVGRRSQLSLGSGPQLLLAYLARTEQKKIISQMEFHKFTDNTILTKSELIEKLQNIRKQGFSISYSEQDEETVGISYPVFNRESRVVAALNVSGPVSRLAGFNQEYVQSKTKEIAQNISKELGYVRKV